MSLSKWCNSHVLITYPVIKVDCVVTEFMCDIKDVLVSVNSLLFQEAELDDKVIQEVQAIADLTQEFSLLVVEFFASMTSSVDRLTISNRNKFT